MDNLCQKYFMLESARINKIAIASDLVVSSNCNCVANYLFLHVIIFIIIESIVRFCFNE